MLLSRPAMPLCRSCRYQLHSLFANGFTVSQQAAQRCYSRAVRPRAVTYRSIHTTYPRGDDLLRSQPPYEEGAEKSSAQLEATARRAHQIFGDTLPLNTLSPDEYTIYERLFGPPLQEITAGTSESLKLLQEDPDSVNAPKQDTLWHENEHSDPEQTVSLKGTREDSDALDGDYATILGDARANRAQMVHSDDMKSATELHVGTNRSRSELEDDNSDNEQDDLNIIEDLGLRTHPFTSMGRFGTSPSTVLLPKESFIDPITSLLAPTSSKHLTEVAIRTFGGQGLPNSTATPSREAYLQQQPISLEASQPHMGEMEANAYLAGVLPGTYVAVMSTLVEVRKRLGSKWVTDLLEKEGGPRILDAGGGGAGALAWREVLRAEWDRLHPEMPSDLQSVPYGKATIITGSPELRHRMSSLLDNTTFLPRLPDFMPARDLLPGETTGPQPRKQYDVVIAPHTLWTLKEDYMRKAQVQNFWSLLNPSGGVLIIIEKGLPRGFELVAGARETLLSHHISTPDFPGIAGQIRSPAADRFHKEEGMIIAPCTNHFQCPMYTFGGKSKGRKDHCHFSQRFIRPSFLQHILGATSRNHEDVKFSYVAVQRGMDRRKRDSIRQGSLATEAAFAGYEDVNQDSFAEDQILTTDSAAPNVLSLPRTILPPLKRKGHVSLDLCTPSGQIERWTIPKSFSKQAYRDARKSQWGDLWALGAKTRVLKTPRIGTHDRMIRNGQASKSNVDVSEGASLREQKAKAGKLDKKSQRKKERRGQIIEKLD